MDYKVFTVISAALAFEPHKNSTSFWKVAAMSHERLQDSSPLEERNSIQGQWRCLIAQSFCVIKFY